MTIKKITDKDIQKFVSILERSNFNKEEFLFHSVPYLGGLKSIINSSFRTISKNKLNILDLGCGTGLTSFLLANLDNKVESIEIYDKKQEIQNSFIIKGKKAQLQLWHNLEKVNHNLHFQFYNGYEFPFKNNQFDLIFCHAVLEHIPSNVLNKVLQEIYRVLKKNGHFIIARTPNKFALTEFLAKSHKTKFSKREIFKLFNKNKYKTILYKKTDFLPEIAPGQYQNILNKIYPITRNIDTFLNNSPLQVFSHHHFIILKKL